MGIAAICLAIVLTILVIYFLNSSRGNLHGNRLNGIETVPISDNRLRELEALIEENEIVERASTRIMGRIIYINIFLNDGRPANGQEIAINSLEFFSEDELSFYDVSFIVDLLGDIDETVFPIMGYKNSNNRIISWTNFNE